MILHQHWLLRKYLTYANEYNDRCLDAIRKHPSEDFVVFETHRGGVQAHLSNSSIKNKA